MGAVIVGGALANKYRNGGGAWERMSWVTGLQKLGYDVYFVEQIVPEACVDASGARAAFAQSVNLDWFLSLTKWFGVADRAALVYAGGAECAGMSWHQLLEVAGSTDLLVNLSGHVTLAPLLDRIRCKAYIDVDPGFTQFWHADPDTPFQLAGHDYYFTIGENIGRPNCSIPTGDIHWRHTRQPVVLEHWPVCEATDQDRFTTVANWRGPYGPIEQEGKLLGLKVHEFRKFARLPELVPQTCELALNIHPADQKDREMLCHHGWQLVDPLDVAAGPRDFRSYIQASGAEFSVAQGIYTETHSGWFSDRSVRYLASGKPVLVQDTGLAENLPVGEGLMVFRTLDEAASGAQEIHQDYAQHSHAARRIAEQHFDATKVLAAFVDEIGINP